MALALAASIGFHSAAAWGAAWWMNSAWHHKLPQTINIRLLGTETSLETGYSGEPLRPKHAEKLFRFSPPSPPSAPRFATLQKKLISQKPLAPRIPGNPPKPDYHRTAVKDRLAAAEPRMDLEDSYKGSPAEARKPDVANEGSSPLPRGQAERVAALDDSGKSDRAFRLDAIRRRIQEALVYPATARRFGWEGSALVRIVLAPDGALSALSLESSSRIAVLDREVLAAVRRAAPYPYVEGPIVVPVVFDLRAP